MAKPPTYRARDIQLDVDLIEEIARLASSRRTSGSGRRRAKVAGYQMFASLLPDGQIPQTNPRQQFDLEYRLKTTLKFLGYTELYTNLLVSETDAKRFGGLYSHLQLKNPLSKDWEYLKTSLLPSLLSTVNKNEAGTPISLFEMAQVFRKHKKGLPLEQLRCTLATHQNFDRLKGHLDAIASSLSIAIGLSIQDTNYLEPGRSAAVTAGKQVIGAIGELHTSLRLAYQLNQPLWVLDLDVDAVKTLPKLPFTLQDPPKFQPVREDLTLVLPPRTPVGPILEALRRHPTVTNLEFRGKYQDAITVSLDFSDPNSQLTQEEVNQEKSNLVKQLERKFGVTLKT